jgi:uncharacterized protein involved in exopolysaccharide biosynthesis
MLGTELRPRETSAGVASASIEISVGELYQTLHGNWRLIGGVTLAGAALATIIAFLIPNKYTSTAQLMPPDQQSISNTSSLTPLSGMGSGLLGAGAGGLISQRTPGQTVVGVLTSDTELDYIIDKFNLRHVYREKYIEDARKALLNHSEISEDKKSGIVNISVTDKNKQLAHDVATAYVDELNQIMNNLGTSSAKRERVFLEQRLKEVKAELDSSSLALSQFSSHNATMDIEKQAEATLESADRLQAQLIAAESELSGIKTGYTENSPEVRAAQARIDELQAQLNAISGAGQKVDSTGLKEGEVAPSIRKLPLLGAAYADLYRQVTIEETLYETLSKQYELARVEEAKEIPPVRMLGSPSYPEKKSAPRRSIIIALGGALACFACVMWILARRYWGFFALREQAS